MPFGLSNIPAAFQCFMNEICKDFLDVYVIMYLDNILIYSNNLENHWKYIKEVLSRLWKNGLYVSPIKYVFHQDKIKFLGFILGSNRLRIDREKIQNIQE